MNVIVYGKTETSASRGRKPRTGETLSYRAIKDYNEKTNQDYDEVILIGVSKPDKSDKGAKKCRPQ